MWKWVVTRSHPKATYFKLKNGPNTTILGINTPREIPEIIGSLETLEKRITSRADIRPKRTILRSATTTFPEIENLKDFSTPTANTLVPHSTPHRPNDQLWKLTTTPICSRPSRGHAMTISSTTNPETIDTKITDISNEMHLLSAIWGGRPWNRTTSTEPNSCCPFWAAAVSFEQLQCHWAVLIFLTFSVYFLAHQ